MNSPLIVVIIAGLTASYICRKLRLSALVGMLLVGILCGPHFFNLLSPSALAVAADLRKLAFAAILSWAIFELQRDLLNQALLPTLLMATIPVLFEIGCLVPLSHFGLHLGWQESGILGIVLSAVSLSFFVPKVVNLKQYAKTGIQNIAYINLASIIFNNVFTILIFTLYMSLYFKNQFTLIPPSTAIPISIIAMIVLGLLFGYIFNKITIKYDSFFTPIRSMLLLFGFILVMIHIEDLVHNILPVASLLGVLVMGVVILEKSEANAHILSDKFKTLCIFCELLLFVLIGAQVNIHIVWNVSLVGLGVIACSLILRSGVINYFIKGYGLTRKERAFFVGSNIPKATVQAVIAAIPMELGVPGGDIILAVSVIAILVTTLIADLGMIFTGEPALSSIKNSSSNLINMRESVPAIGKSIRSKRDGSLWEVIDGNKVSKKSDKRETEKKMIPAIKLKLYQPPPNHSFGGGKYITIILTENDSFDDEWEILPDHDMEYH